MVRLTRINATPPVNTVAPTLVQLNVVTPATAQQNRPIFCRRGTWTSARKWTRTLYQWKKNGVAITGATRPTYDAPDSSTTIGDAITCLVTVEDHRGFQASVETAGVTLIADAQTYVTAESLGFKAGIQTTGSISASSNSLTVASATGFTIGDKVIVEIGGEAGAGAIGTKGVGGSWPIYSYANTTAMNADTSRANGTFAWAEDTGLVYVFATATNTWSQAYASDPVLYKAYPVSLRGTITNIVGNVLTLSSSAVVSATNANVYFDNTGAGGAGFDAGDGGFGGETELNNHVVTFGAGTYVFGGFALSPVQVGAHLQISVLTGITIKGAGITNTIIKAPKGCMSMAFGFSQCSDAHMRDLHVIGNFNYDTGGGYPGNGNAPGTATNAPAIECAAVTVSLCNYATFERVKFTNTWAYSIATAQTTYVWAYDCQTVHESGHPRYFQWQYLWAVSNNGGTYDCSVTSTHMFGGFEAFNSLQISHTRPTCVNAAISCNSSGDVLFDTPNITITANAQKTEAGGSFSPFFNQNSEVISINANAGGGSQTQTPIWVRNPTVTAAANFNSYSQNLKIIITAPAPNYVLDGLSTILVSGGYPNQPQLGGLIELPNYTPATGGQFDVGPQGFASDGDCYLRGLRFKSTPNAAYDGTNRAMVYFGNPAKGSVINCVSDQISAAVESGNMTNAEYEAL